MLTAKIALIDQTNKISFAQLTHIASALATQVNRDVSKHWPVSATVTAHLAAAKVPIGTWPIYIVDNLPAGEGGYHWDTTHNQPYAVVLNGPAWTVAASHELCLTGDTKVSLLNGSEVPIKDLVGVPEFWVYSCKPDGSIRPGRGHSARLTKRDAPIVRVTLDNGQSVRCTADHPFMMRDGSYVEAGNLVSGASLMPLYRQRAVLDPKKTRKGMTDYEQVWNPATGEWVYTHRMVVPYCSEGYVRHHKDFNRFNNEPPNIQVMTWEAHRKLHADHIAYYTALNRGKPRTITPNGRATMSANGKRALLAYNGSDKHKVDLAAYYETPGVREKHGEQMRAWAASAENVDRLTAMNQTPEARARNGARLTVYNKSAGHREVARQVGTQAMALLWSNPDFVERRATITSEVLAKRNSDPVFQAKAHHARWHAKRGVFSPDCPLCAEAASALPEAANNHKVVSVEECGCEDVYDITVDKYHNFATAAGVFVHNCEMLIDPWGNRLTTARVMTVNGNTVGLGTAKVHYLVEACDPPEAEGYEIDGVAVSDWVYPQYYITGTKPGRYSFTGACSTPLEVPFGGYISWLDPTSDDWMQLTWLDKGKPPSIANLGSATGFASLKEFVDSKSGGVKRVAQDAKHPAVLLAQAINATP